METAYIIRNGVIIGSGTNSSLNPDSSSTYIINCTIVSETGLEIEVANYDGDFTKIKQTIADGGKVELRTNFNSSNYILEPSRIEEDYATFNTIDKNANITIKVTEYGINDVSYIDLNSSGGATIDDTTTSTDTVWSSQKTSDEIAKVETELNANLEDKADTDKVVKKIYIKDTSSQDARTLIQNHWSEFDNFEFYNLHIDTAKWAWDAEIYAHTQEYGTVLLRSYGNDASNIWYGKVYAGVWTWKELATMDKVADVPETTVDLTGTDIRGSIKYMVKSGICYVSAWGVLSDTVKAAHILVKADVMPKPIISCGTVLVHGDSGLNGKLVGQLYVDYNKALSLHIYPDSVGDTGFGSFSYPVAES